MAITEQELRRAEERMEASRAAGYALAARYDRRRSRVVVKLSTGVELAFPTELAEGLRGAAEDALANIEISPSGLGLHWPKLDADLYVPALMKGVFGTRRQIPAVAMAGSSTLATARYVPLPAASPDSVAAPSMS